MISPLTLSVIQTDIITIISGGARSHRQQSPALMEQEIRHCGGGSDGAGGAADKKHQLYHCWAILWAMLLMRHHKGCCNRLKAV